MCFFSKSPQAGFVSIENIFRPLNDTYTRERFSLLILFLEIHTPATKSPLIGLPLSKRVVCGRRGAGD